MNSQKIAALELCERLGIVVREACPECTRLFLAWVNTPEQYRKAREAAKWAYQAHLHGCPDGMGKVNT